MRRGQLFCLALLLPAFTHARTPALVALLHQYPRVETAYTDIHKQDSGVSPQRSGDPIDYKASCQLYVETVRYRDASEKALAATFRKRKGISYKYDVKRETGAYAFDTVYKLRIPATKQFNISLNAGYTYYDKYAAGRVRTGTGGFTSGVTGGLSPMFVGRPRQSAGATGSLRQQSSFVRLNVECVSYPDKKRSAGKTDCTSPGALAQDLSARIYVDSRITTRKSRGAFSTNCLFGLSTNVQRMPGTTPFFIGFGIGYRFQ